MTDWIQLEDITLHSGRRSSFKVECDGLSDELVESLCALLAKVVPPFGAVSGVPTGGLRVEEAMRQYVTAGPLLVVDDVWTTGGSVRAHIAGLPPEAGYVGHVGVLFARGPVTGSVSAVLSLHRGLWEL